jgi:hypothetical protein
MPTLFKQETPIITLFGLIPDQKDFSDFVYPQIQANKPKYLLHE